MKKLKFLAVVQKIISCLFVIQLLFIVCLTLHCIVSKAWKFYDVFEVIFLESILIVGWIISADRWVFVISGKDKIFAYQKLWKPYVKNGETEHKGILPTDFVGIRIDEDYFSLM